MPGSNNNHLLGNRTTLVVTDSLLWFTKHNRLIRVICSEIRKPLVALSVYDSQQKNVSFKSHSFGNRTLVLWFTKKNQLLTAIRSWLGLHCPWCVYIFFCVCVWPVRTTHFKDVYWIFNHVTWWANTFITHIFSFDTLLKNPKRCNHL